MQKWQIKLLNDQRKSELTKAAQDKLVSPYLKMIRLFTDNYPTEFSGVKHFFFGEPTAWCPVYHFKRDYHEMIRNKVFCKLTHKTKVGQLIYHGQKPFTIFYSKHYLCWFLVQNDNIVNALTEWIKKNDDVLLINRTIAENKDFSFLGVRESDTFTLSECIERYRTEFMDSDKKRLWFKDF